ncbi:TPA: Asp-tRNA(Asn)/Glu-tRNA(Gln) amidotransferase GatCAB subunit A, partial [Patescibacteria group bacterium]|nr:Asp-tRNA(Asn)/Glu-tRNA(Gln) amidotransferase GatCAB subunit A [Candidatus Gracilibacteria bacterium]
KARQQFRRDFSKLFSQYDIILTPTAPGVAWKLGERLADPLQEYLEDLYTVPANIG